MAFVDVKEDWSGINLKIAPKTEKVVRVFTVLLDGTDSNTEAPFAAREATGIPRKGDTYPGHDWIVCDSIEPSPVSPTMFKVVVKYVRKSWSASDEDNPLEEPAQIDFASITVVEPVDADVYGTPIVNSAGEGYDPPVTREFHDLVVRITRNEVDFDPMDILNFKGTCNLNPFWGAPRGVAKIANINAPMVRVNDDLVYRRVTYEIHLRRPEKELYEAIGLTWGQACEYAWQTRLLDRGFREIAKDDAGNVEVDADGATIYKVFRGKYDIPLSDPVMLDGTGSRLAKDADPVWFWFYRYPFADWSSRGF